METATVAGPGNETVRQIARTATRLFAARGYDATPVRAIVEEAGVTKPTLYYYFGSKEGLAQVLLTAPLAGLVETMKGLLDDRPADPVRRLVGMVEANFAFCREDLDRARFIYALFFGPVGSGLAAELGRSKAQVAELLGGAVAGLGPAGLIDPGRVEACTTALRGLIVIHTVDYLYRGGELGPGLAGRLVGDLLRGFGTPTARRAVAKFL